MIRKTFLILTIAMSLFALSCSGVGNKHIAGSSGGGNEGGVTSSGGDSKDITGNGEGNEDIAGGERSNEDITVRPTPNYETREAKDFLDLFSGKTSVNYSSIKPAVVFRIVARISNNGKSLLELYPYSKDKLYEFESAKSSKIAYYTVSNNIKEINSSFPDKTYYSYVAFKVDKDNESHNYYDVLFKYNENGSFKEKSQKFKSENFGTDAKGKPDWTKPKKDIDINSIDFSPMFPSKDDIDFTLSEDPSSPNPMFLGRIE